MDHLTYLLGGQLKELLKTLPKMIMFVTIAEKKSFSAAAEALGISKSVISDHMNALEKSLSVRLLNRSTRNLSLTEAGLAYVEYCQRVLDNAVEGKEVVTSLNSKPMGNLTITTTTHFGSIRLPQIISDFNKIYPDISIQLNLSNGFVDIVNKRIDIAIRHNHGKPTDSSLCSKLLDDVPIWICASKNYIKQNPPIKTPEDLEHHQWLHVEWLTNQWNLKDKNNVLKQISITPHSQVNTVEGVLALLKLDMGIAIMPEFAAISDIEKGSLIRVLPEYSLPTMQVSAIYANREHLPMKIRAFIDFITQELKKDQMNRALTSI